MENGYKLHYEDIVENFLEEMSADECREVIDILDMYRALKSSYKCLPNKAGISEEEIHFDGFDGNDEPNQYLYTTFFILDLDRFSELKYGQDHPDFNSHGWRLNRYRSMLKVWNSMEDNHNLSANKIREILDAR